MLIKASHFKTFHALLGIMLLVAQPVWACPDADGLVDLNCDGKVVILAFGDSITFGQRDALGIGYPGRLQIAFPNVEVINAGKPGENTIAGKSRAAWMFATRPDADYVLLLEGVNDYWISGHSASTTRSRLLQMMQNAENNGSLAILASLTAIRRDYQKSWVAAVNGAIASYARINFFSLGEGIISSDLIHPSTQGYDRMAELVAIVLRTLANQERPADLDNDGIYDFAEARYGSSPALYDTDGDGISDGDEVFVYGSNPVSLDSDGDGLSDSYEVFTLRSNPASAKPGAPKITTFEIIPPNPQ